MNKEKIIIPLAQRGNGAIYLGVVGAVRTGKSTFIKKCIENLIVPSISDEMEKKRYLDEIPQTANGKTIMTTEPKFVPSQGANLKVDDYTCNIKLIDCVGYVIPHADGYNDQNGNPRMVMTPWFPDAIPFTEAASIGTEKVIKDHSTIGIVVTSDGSFGELNREDYLDAEAKVINELKSIGKPFIVILNTAKPGEQETLALRDSLVETYDVPVLPMKVDTMGKEDIYEILKIALKEFPVLDIKFSIPEWIHVLNKDYPIKKEYLERIKECSIKISKLKDVDNMLDYFKDSKYISKAYISNVDEGTGIITVNLDSSEELYKETLKDMLGESMSNKASLIKIFATYKESRETTKSINEGLKMAKKTGYGIVYPTLKDMKLETPEIIKQGNRYGVKLKAVASSIHMIKVDVESTFEPIIGTEAQSKELIDYIMKDYKENPDSIWQSEIFGRSLDTIVSEGIKAKLSMVGDQTRYKLSQTVSKIVNKGSNTLIAIVI